MKIIQFRLKNQDTKHQEEEILHVPSELKIPFLTYSIDKCHIM